MNLNIKHVAGGLQEENIQAVTLGRYLQDIQGFLRMCNCNMFRKGEQVIGKC